MSRCVTQKLVPVVVAAVLGVLASCASAEAQSYQTKQKTKQGGTQQHVKPKMAPGSQSDPAPRGSLGIYGRSVADGVRVTEVVEGGAFERVGGEVGDVITSVDGRPISDLSDLRDALDDGGPVVRLRIIDVRSGRLVYRNVDLSR